MMLFTLIAYLELLYGRSKSLNLKHSDTFIKFFNHLTLFLNRSKIFTLASEVRLIHQTSICGQSPSLTMAEFRVSRPYFQLVQFLPVKYFHYSCCFQLKIFSFLFSSLGTMNLPTFEEIFFSTYRGLGPLDFLLFYLRRIFQLPLFITDHLVKWRE